MNSEPSSSTPLPSSTSSESAKRYTGGAKAQVDVQLPEVRKAGFYPIKSGQRLRSTNQLKQVRKAVGLRPKQFKRALRRARAETHPDLRS
jgi:hypothetical protein